MAPTYYPKSIQTIISDVVERLKKTIDPEYIIMAGSIGKGSWIYAGEKLLSDFEFVFVSKKKWSITQKKQLQKDLQKKHGQEISLKGFLLKKVQKKVLSNYSFGNPGYISLSFFDTFSNPVILYQKTKGKLNLPSVDVHEIPVWEAWKLYVNRLGELMEAGSHTKNDRPTDLYKWLKVFESAGDACLIINRSYVSNIQGRMNLIRETSVPTNGETNLGLDKSFSLFAQALRARANHNLSQFSTDYNLDELNKMALGWLLYFQRVLSKEEKISARSDKDFYASYLSDKKLKNNYLDISGVCNKHISNAIKIMYHPRLFFSGFKFYAFHHSWRHIILLAVSAWYYEFNTGFKQDGITNRVVEKILSRNYLNNEMETISLNHLIKHWKILR